MTEAAFEIRAPNALLRFGIDQNKIQQNVNEWLVLTLFTEGHISSGKAAKLLNISRVDFLALLRKRGIAYIDYSSEELAEEFETIENLNLDSSS